MVYVDHNRSRNLENIVVNSTPSIVSVSSIKENTARSSVGSGFFIEPGIVVTSYHVVKDSDIIMIEDHENRLFYASLYGYDEMADVALLEVFADGRSSLTFEARNPRIGESIVVIGHPFNYRYTVSTGIVSHISRNNPSNSQVPFMQIDASVNVGNSGGPVLSVNGNVLGMVQGIVSPSQTFAGIALATPTLTLLDIIANIKKSPENVVTYPKLDIVCQYIPDVGVLVDDVNENSKLRGLLEPGDLIVSINDIHIFHLSDIAYALSLNYETTRVSVYRRNNTHTFVVSLIEEQH